jgi:hypothetical protein
MTAWRKSSYSNGTTQGNCVEVAIAAQTVGVRDSKNPRPELAFSVRAWSRFVGAARPE